MELMAHVLNYKSIYFKSYSSHSLLERTISVMSYYPILYLYSFI